MFKNIISTFTSWKCPIQETDKGRHKFILFGIVLLSIWLASFIWEFYRSATVWNIEHSNNLLSTLTNVVSPFILGHGEKYLPLRLVTYSFVYGCLPGLLESIITLLLLIRFAEKRLKLTELLCIYSLGIIAPGLVFAYFFDDPSSSATLFGAQNPLIASLIALTVISPKAPLLALSAKKRGIALLLVALLILYFYNRPGFFFTWWWLIIQSLQLCLLILVFAGAPIVSIFVFWFVEPFITYVFFMFAEVGPNVEVEQHPGSLLVHLSIALTGILSGLFICHIHNKKKEREQPEL